MRVLVTALILILALAQIAPGQARWKEFHGPEIGPGPRYGHGMALDTHRKVIVLFGGRNEDNMNDTWEFDLTTLTWTKKDPNSAPRERRNFAIAYDPSLRKTVIQSGFQLFDPEGSGFYSPSTWEWDGQDWHFITTSGPDKRSLHSMVWDDTRKQIVLFGGHNNLAEFESFDGTWIYERGGWTERFPFFVPHRRYAHTMAYDSANKRVLMYGGKHGTLEYTDQVYAWNGRDWKLLAKGGPGNRAFLASAFDSDRGVLVMFGGEYLGRFNDTWELRGNTWKKLNVKAPLPARRERHAMVYDPFNKRMWMFGGQTKNGNDGRLYYLTLGPEFDLIPTSLKVQPKNRMVRGSKASFIVRIKNQSKDDSTGFRITFYFSKDDTFSGNDFMVFSKEIKEGIAASKINKYVFNRRISKSIPVGDYYLVVSIDPTGNDVRASNNIVVSKSVFKIVE